VAAAAEQRLDRRGIELTVQLATDEEQRAHEAFLALMAKRGKPIWRELEQQAADAARAAEPAAAA
jgi:hypothetical protein